MEAVVTKEDWEEAAVALVHVASDIFLEPLILVRATDHEGRRMAIFATTTTESTSRLIELLREHCEHLPAELGGFFRRDSF